MKDFNVRQQCLPGVRDKENSGRETLGKFFYDLAKITFTALVAGNLVSFRLHCFHLSVSKSLKFRIMELNLWPLIAFFAVICVICIGIIIWMYTKRGKKWLKNL